MGKSKLLLIFQISLYICFIRGESFKNFVEEMEEKVTNLAENMR